MYSGHFLRRILMKDYLNWIFSRYVPVSALSILLWVFLEDKIVLIFSLLFISVALYKHRRNCRLAASAGRENSGYTCTRDGWAMVSIMLTANIFLSWLRGPEPWMFWALVAFMMSQVLVVTCFALRKAYRQELANWNPS